MHDVKHSLWRGLAAGFLLGTFLPLAPTGWSAIAIGEAAATPAALTARGQDEATDQPSPSPATRPSDDSADGLALRLLSQAEGMLRLGRPDAAVDLARRVPRTGPHAAAATRVRMWANFAAGTFGQVVAQLRALDVLDGELSFLRGASLLRTGDEEAGRRELQHLWWNEPEGIWGLSALRELAAGDTPYAAAERAAIKKTVPVATSTSSTQGSGQAILDTLGRAAPRGTRLAVEIYRAQGLRLLHQEEFTLAVDKLNTALRHTRDPQLKRAIQLPLADAERHRGHVRSATRIYDAVIAGGDDALTLQALAHAGQMFIERQRYPEAKHRFEQQLLSNPLAGARRAALWGLGWVAFRTGGYTDARRFFRTLYDETPHGPDAPRALYWGARSLAELGQAEQAQRELAAIIARFPLDYYAHRAATILPASWSAEPAPLANSATLAVVRIQEMVKSGMVRRATAALEKLDGDQAEILGPADLDALVAAADEVGAGKLARRLSTRRCRRYPDGSRASLRVLQRLFPKPLVDDLSLAARSQRLDEGLVIGLVRQESGFNARAVSPVGALGLMQLMPQTAKGLVQENRPRHTPTTEQLLDPQTNMELGVRYLGRMLRSFSRHAEYALAAYNAGPGAVTRWRLQRGELPPDIFVEEIPYEETRQYVQRVLSWRRTWEYLATARAQVDAQQTELADASGLHGSR